MVPLHVAYFRQDTGVYVREWKGLAPDLDVNPALVGSARLMALNAWQQRVAPAAYGEVGLDVTVFDYPLGDFCWMVFRPVERMLDWPERHKFIQIDRTTRQIVVNCESARPVRSTPDRLVIDITGTPLEPFYGELFGQLVRKDHHWALLPARVPTQRALEAARMDLALVPELPRVLAHV